MSAVIFTASQLRSHIAAHEAAPARKRSSKQVWEVGSTVSVGFVRGLVILARDGDAWLLRDASGRRYVWSRAFGLERAAYAA